MTRVNIYDHTAEGDYEEPRYVGHFDIDTAESWSDIDPVTGNGSGKDARGQAIYRTAGGKWLLCHWTHHSGEAYRFEYTTAAAAHEWLLANNKDEAVTKYFGSIPVEEDRRSGPPEIGGRVNVRLGDDLIKLIDRARRDGESQAAAIRRLLRWALEQGKVL